MLNWFKLTLFIALSSTFVACGSSSEEKAQDRASDLVTEYNVLVSELNSTVPNASWSDAELAKYEAKLNRFSSLQSQIDQADGKNGVIIIGGDNKRFLSERREQLYQVRLQKSQLAEKKKSDDKLAELKKLLQQAQDLQTQLIVMGKPASDWSIEDLRAFETTAASAVAKYDEMTSLVNSFPYSSEKIELLKNIEKLKLIATTDLERVQKVILDSALVP